MIRPRFDNAACRAPGLEPLFARGTQARELEAVCGRCRDRPECLAWALEHEAHGFWGGHTAAARKRLRARFGIELEEIFAGHLGIHNWKEASSDGDVDRPTAVDTG